nr:hypothetical protein Iba_chr02dCG6240 [Ipomoea batatas]
MNEAATADVGWWRATWSPGQWRGVGGAARCRGDGLVPLLLQSASSHPPLRKGVGGGAGFLVTCRCCLGAWAGLIWRQWRCGENGRQMDCRCFFIGASFGTYAGDGASTPVVIETQRGTKLLAQSRAPDKIRKGKSLIRLLDGILRQTRSSGHPIE